MHSEGIKNLPLVPVHTPQSFCLGAPGEKQNEVHIFLFISNHARNQAAKGQALKMGLKLIAGKYEHLFRLFALLAASDFIG